MREFKTVIFDLDSTLVPFEGLLEIAHQKGFDGEIEKITQQGNEGEIPFSESLSKRLEIIKPSKEDIGWLARLYKGNVIFGSQETIDTLKALDINVYLISGSFQDAVEELGNYLGIPTQQCFSNILAFDENGEYAGIDLSQDLATTKGKGILLNKLNLPRKIALVGDGSTDLEAKEFVDLFIGFGGVVKRDIVKENAQIFIEKADMREVLKYII